MPSSFSILHNNFMEQTVSELPRFRGREIKMSKSRKIEVFLQIERLGKCQIRQSSAKGTFAKFLC